MPDHASSPPPTPTAAPSGNSAQKGGFGQILRNMDAAQRRSLSWMGLVILVLTTAGWGMFVLLVEPRHLQLLGIGIAVTAYTLGMRHAFDADHISAIDTPPESS